MSSKLLFNSAERCVDEMLSGLVAAHPGLRLDAERRVVSEGDRDSRENVALISGGGSGHEPFAAGYVGSGMLTAAVAGSVFTSPPSSNIFSAIQQVTRNYETGALVIVPNYTGDCLNFGLAVEKTRSQGAANIELVVIGEDCALESQNSRAGRRGLCGLLFVYKICGWMSREGRRLEELSRTARRIAKDMATVGVGLTACTLPGSDTPLFRLADDEIEFGLGVHGEAGLSRLKMCTASQVVRLMLDRLKDSLGLTGGTKVAVLVNNLGGSSQLEQWIIASEAQKQLTAMNIRVCRMYVGPLMTSLGMSGVQICVLKFSADNLEVWSRALDAETDAPAWPGGRYSSCPRLQTAAPPAQVTASGTGTRLGSAGDCLAVKCLQAAAQALRAAEQRLNQLDSGCGDGDCGSTLRRFADGVVGSLSTLHADEPSRLMAELADIAEKQMGGTSGAIYGIGLFKASISMSGDRDRRDWALAWSKGLEGIMEYSTARSGDRTMLDALIPASEEFSKHGRSTREEVLEALGLAVAAAQRGCAETCSMKANVGRASYVSSSHCNNMPDAGASAVTVWLDAIYQVMLSSY